MILPKMPVTLPACLNGQLNGKLPASLLVDTPGLAGGPVVRLVAPAARSWRAMAAAASQDGIVLKATSLFDSYRPYPVQFNVFVDRYWPDPEPGFIGERWWAGHYDLAGNWVRGHDWYQKPNTAVAAVPGTSNHGRGLAVDVAGAGIAGPILTWLLAHAEDYGWSWETDSESWHIRYCTGDAIPDVVLAYEHSLLLQGQEFDMRVYAFRGLADCPAELQGNRVVVTDGVGAYWVRPNSWQYGDAALNGSATVEVRLATNVAGALPVGTSFAEAFRQLTGGCVHDPTTTFGLADWRKSPGSAGGGGGVSGPMDLSDTAKADVRDIVDEELDEAFQAGADADA